MCFDLPMVGKGAEVTHPWFEVKFRFGGYSGTLFPATRGWNLCFRRMAPVFSSFSGKTGFSFSGSTTTLDWFSGGAATCIIGMMPAIAIGMLAPAESVGAICGAGFGRHNGLFTT